MRPDHERRTPGLDQGPAFSGIFVVQGWSAFRAGCGSAAAEARRIADPEAGVLAIAEELALRHRRLVRMGLADMRDIGPVIALTHHQPRAVADALVEGLAKGSDPNPAAIAEQEKTKAISPTKKFIVLLSHIMVCIS